jgi:molybdenum cofactor cytidylyltransferase
MIAGLILAAGESTRMGRDKALLVHRGKTFLEHILATLREGGIERVGVVLGHHAEEILRASSLPDVEVAIHPDYRRGQTTSLQAGLRALGTERQGSAVAAASPPPGAHCAGDDEDVAATVGDLEAIVLCLVDHPAVSADTVRKLVESFQRSRAPVVLPTYRGRRGHPVLISRALFTELSNLDPDTGANTVIHRYDDAATFVEVDDPGILHDVDDADSYRRLVTREG